MNRTHRNFLRSIGVVAFAAAFLLSAGAANAVPRYLEDGAIQRADGGWDLPEQGTCPADTSQLTRPECVALRLNIVQASCVSPNYSWTTSGVCNDDVNNSVLNCVSSCSGNPATDEVTCEEDGGRWIDRVWNGGTSVCGISMLGDDRNNVSCALDGGNWSTAGTCIGVWVMPPKTDYTPSLLIAGNSTGDQCLRCHNALTQYNGPRVRDVENFLYTGHKNMARKVTPGTPWGGPPFACSNPSYTDEQLCEENGEVWFPTEYPSDDTGNVMDWDAGTYTTTSGTWSMAWIYGDWLAPFPRVIAKMPASATKTCKDPRYTTQAACEGAIGVGGWVFNAGASYSCARCHTTGWTSDAAVAAQNNNDARLTKEPERSFQGITWDRTGNAPANKVNMAGGVSNDPNGFSSFDVWGISCNRCHNAAIDTAKFASCFGLTQGTCTGLGGTWAASTGLCTAITAAQCNGNGGSAGYSAPDGMSTHNNSMTTFESNGYCSDVRFTAQAQCDAAGASWMTSCTKPGSCLNGTSPTSGACLKASSTWTKYDTQTLCLNNAGTWNGTGCIGDATKTTQNACEFAAEVWRGTRCSPDNTQITQATCEASLLNEWYDSRCSVKGVCNDPTYTNSLDCRSNGKFWAVASDVVRCLDLGGKWTGTKENRGQVITGLCMNCHRQETAGLPYGATSTDGVNVNYTATDPAGQLKVGPYHNTVTFLSHPQANQFLNSPHARFTGTFDKIPTSRNYTSPGYSSYFMNDGEAAATGNGCTGCHDVHESVVENTSPFSAIHEECTECHAGPYAKDLNVILHPAGIGTPLEEKDTNPSEACMTCHMPGEVHLFRINTAATYSTFPATALTTTSNANTQPENGYNATWVDIDMACGQCHGGGSNHVATTGTMTAGSATLTVPSTTGFAAGQRIRIADAGSLTYDDIGAQTAGDFDSFILSVTPPSTVTLVGKATFAVSGVGVEQNATKNGASYKSKTYLAQLANGIHSGVALPPVYVNFSTKLESPNTLKVDVDASTSSCSGSPANCNLYEWDCDNNGTFELQGVTQTCTFATAGSKTIKLQVTEYGKSGGSVSKSVNTYTPVVKPVPGGMTCGTVFTANTWVAAFTDASTANPPATVKTVTVNWGDGTAVTTKSVPTARPWNFTHTYLKTGNFTITQTAIDTTGQSTSTTCPGIAPAYFKIAGTVKNLAGTLNLASATVKVYNGATLIKTLTTSAVGAFDTGFTLKPGTQYKLVVTKTGYTFTVPEWGPLPVGPSYTGVVINAN